jgi:modulator of FtsH protease HflK
VKRGDLTPGSTPVRRRESELARMARPLMGVVGFVLRVYHWPIAALVLIYLASGITSVRPGEVALVLRFGRLVGDTPAARVHRPGVLFTLPAPMDEVVRVNIQEVRSLRLYDLTYTSGDGSGRASFARRETIDPEKDGYCLTGDRNVLQALVVVRFRVRDPIAWALGHATPEDELRDAVLSAMVQGSGEQSVDDLLLGDGRTELSRMALVRTQAECDGRGLGAEVLAIELDELKPPLQVQAAFSDVINSAITAVTAIEDARRERAGRMPGAKAEARRILADARMFAESRTARARGESAAFVALVDEAAREGDLLRERLYREALERAFERVRLRILPPPPDGGRYEDFRITLPF